MLGVDDIHVLPLYDKVCGWNFVGDVLVFLPRNNGRCTKSPIYEAVDYPDGILITERPDLISVSTGEGFNTNHDLYSLVGMFYLSIY